MIKKAVRTNRKNPVLHCSAGIIKRKAGEKEKGIELIKTALNTNPFITDIELKNEVSKYLVAA